jgi:hypothetical protein
VTMRIVDSICTGLVLLASALVWAQDDQHIVPVPAVIGPISDASPSSDNDADQMLTPPPVSGQAYPTAFTSEERSNYLRGGVNFNAAYSDNVLAPTNLRWVSYVSCSIWPTIALDETVPRMHLALNYAPGFTFYPGESNLNQADQSASMDFQYRLSPHVTFSARDGLQKSTSVFDQPDLGAGAVSGGIQEPNQSVIAPVADVLSNSGGVGITYQFAANSMIGVGGTFSNLHYTNQAEVPGLFDSKSQGGLVFYLLRISNRHYIGATYQYQRLLSYPTSGTNETQTHALLLFYTLYATSRFSISFFGGPQYADVGPQFFATGSTPSPGARSLNPAAGGSFSLQGRLSSIAISYSHTISSGGGLIGSVQMDTASASIRHQLSRALSASVAGSLTQNDVLTATPEISNNGHTVSGGASLQRQFGHVNLQLGYTRIHQEYNTVTALSGNPNASRESFSISYQFSRPLGR